MTDNTEFYATTEGTQMSLSGSSSTFVTVVGSQLSINPSDSIAPGTYELTIETVKVSSSKVMFIDTLTITVTPQVIVESLQEQP